MKYSTCTWIVVEGKHASEQWLTEGPTIPAWPSGMGFLLKYPGVWTSKKTLTACVCRQAECIRCVYGTGIILHHQSIKKWIDQMKKLSKEQLMAMWKRVKISHQGVRRSCPLHSPYRISFVSQFISTWYLCKISKYTSKRGNIGENKYILFLWRFYLSHLIIHHV